MYRTGRRRRLFPVAILQRRRSMVSWYARDCGAHSVIAQVRFHGRLLITFHERAILPMFIVLQPSACYLRAAVTLNLIKVV